MSDMSGYGLTENPFSLLPSTRITKWAGRKEVKNQLLDIVKSVLATDTGVSEFVFLHGSFGAGKSHALRFLATQINDVNAASFNSNAIYVPKVKLSEKISFLIATQKRYLGSTSPQLRPH
jgi:type II secretory pathway predicted ATPase ExeA